MGRLRLWVLILFLMGGESLPTLRMTTSTGINMMGTWCLELCRVMELSSGKMGHITLASLPITPNQERGPCSMLMGIFLLGNGLTRQRQGRGSTCFPRVETTMEDSPLVHLMEMENSIFSTRMMTGNILRVSMKEVRGRQDSTN